MNPSFLAPSVGNSVPDLAATISVSSAQDIVLTPSSFGLQSITMTALGKSVFLPPVYTNVPGQTKYTVKNNGIYPFGVRDSAGNLLTGIAGGGDAIFSIDNTSNWSFTGNILEPGLITIDNTFSSTFSAAATGVYIPLDTNTSIHFASIASGFAAFVVDNLGRVISTPVTVSATASSLPRVAFKISNTSAMLFFSSSTTDNQAVVLTLTGASPSLSLSVGTAQNINTYTLASVGWDGESSILVPKICQLAPTLFLASFFASAGTATGVNVIALSVAGAVITIGAGVQILGAGASAASSTAAYALTATTGLVLYKASTAAPFANTAAVVTVTGTTCTVGTPATLTNCASSQSTPCSSLFISPTKVAIADDNNTTQVTTSGVTISGTTATAWTASNIETGLTTNLITFTAASATRFNPHVWFISAATTNQFGVWYFDSSGISRVLVVTENAGTLTLGQILYRSISTGATSASGAGMPFQQGTSDFLSMRIEASSVSLGVFKPRACGNRISGTSITAGQSIALESLPIQAQPAVYNYARLPSGDYLAPSTTQIAVMCTVHVIRSNGDAVTLRGFIKTPTLTSSPNLVPVVSSNRIVLLGNTQEEGTTVAAGTFQLRLLTLEIAI